MEIKYNSSGEPLNKLINGELPWGWVLAYQDFTNPRDNKLTNLSVNTRYCSTIDEEIEALKSFINYYYEYKEECLSLGECFYKYFEDMHMHCHNSADKDFEFVSPAEERLKYINDNYEKLKNNEYIIENLSQILITTITENPGMLQSDLIKRYNTDIKDNIRQEISFLNSTDKIHKEKFGRTYKLYVNNKKSRIMCLIFAV